MNNVEFDRALTAFEGLQAGLEKYIEDKDIRSLFIFSVLLCGRKSVKEDTIEQMQKLSSLPASLIENVLGDEKMQGGDFSFASGAAEFFSEEQKEALALLSQALFCDEQ